MSTLFTPQDIEQIKALGLTAEQVAEQLATYRQGSVYTQLGQPAEPGNGLLQLSADDEQAMIRLHEQASGDEALCKFIPASGAASRMFKPLAAWLHAGAPVADEPERFLSQLQRFPFYIQLHDTLLREGCDITQPLTMLQKQQVVRALLRPEGLGYESYPKGLLPFHTVAGKVRSALDEQLEEARSYLRRNDGSIHLHCTVAPGKTEQFNAFFGVQQAAFNAQFNTPLAVGLSEQQPATDLLAATPAGLPFRDEYGRLLFRPGGHGALLNNLNMVNADVVFIKNVDNVLPKGRQGVMVRYKKLLGGVLLHYRRQVFEGLHLLDQSQGAAAMPPTLRHLPQLLLAMGVQLPPQLATWPWAKQNRWYHNRLNRPFRVCGIISNEGEPGGAPFWVRHADGSQSIQIVEPPQVAPHDSGQQQLFNTARYFSPTDFALSLKGYRGGSFNLTDYRDMSAAFITSKTYKGRPLQAMEWPGLWNGSMAGFNSILVLVPATTFAPVKSIYDLLRPAHQ